MVAFDGAYTKSRSTLKLYGRRDFRQNIVAPVNHNPFYWNVKDVVTGYQSSNWRACVSQHVLATTPSSGTKYRTSSDGGYVQVNFLRVPPNASFGDAYFLGDPLGADILNTDLLSVSLPDASLQSLALGKYYAKAYDIISPVQGGVILAELHKTLKDLRNPIHGVTRLLTDYRRYLQRVKKSAASASKVKRPKIMAGVRDQWLQTRYGLLPTLGDIDSISQRLTTYAPELTDGYYPCTVTEKVESVVRPSQRILYDLAPTSAGFYMYANARTIQELVVRYKGQVNVGAASGSRFRCSWGVDPIRNFVPTLYELVPYSFLVDYFFNLSRVIQSYMVPSAAIAWTNVTLRGRKSAVETPVFYQCVASGFKLGSFTLPLERTSTVTRFTRSGLSRAALPHPKLSLDIHLSVLKDLNILALGLQQFPKLLLF